ncbi:MAG: filamentous hemagglutinin N-terminal domain-containing protein [Cyanobacteria bacterium P01_A01_bin.68]
MFIPFINKYFPTSSWLGLLTISFLQAPVYAQVIKDGTLPTRVKTTDNLNFTIDSINNQNRAGNNLFHSFKEFSIPTAGSAIFNNSPDVVNIINRVTGGNISNIDGLIKANGNANLFLINPAGIVFGKHARLNIGGSFFGSTAESIKFADDIEFSAIDITTSPLLSINLPLGLQMGNNSAAIKVEGDGYTTTSKNIDNDANVSAPFIVTSLDGLRVKSGNTLALVGGDVSLNGGIVIADSGRIELAGVKKGLVNITNSATKSLVLDYQEVEDFGDVKLSSLALADASGVGSGSIQLQGRNISLKDGSKALLQTQGLESGGQIKVNAAQSIEILGTNSEGTLGSSLLTETIGIGNGGDIIISTPNLFLSQGAIVRTHTFSSARGGNITINASEALKTSDLSTINPNNETKISTLSFNSGAAGDINISTQNLSNSSQEISSATFGIGNGGNVSVSTEELTIFDGGVIASATLGIGNGGNVEVNAKSISLKGIANDNFTPSTLSASSLAIGNAGNLTVNTESLVIQDGGRVDSSTLAFGNSGRVTVNATDFIEVSSTVPGSINPSLIISSANITDESFRQFLGLPAIPSGDSGNVDINTPLLKISDGGEVTVRNDGAGKGGILNINANSILVNSEGKITASTQSGEGGNIDLQVKDGLILRNQSLISAEAGGTGNGGNININSPVIAGLENSDIIANAVEGNGGNININTSGLFGLQFRDELTKDSDITASSQFGVSGTVDINNPAIDPSSSLTQLPTDVVDSSQEVASGCSVNQGNSFTVVGKGGLATNPQEVVSQLNLWRDLRDLNTSNSIKERSIQVKNDSVKPIVEATGWIVDKQGNVEFIAQSTTENNWSKESNCKGEIQNI